MTTNVDPPRRKVDPNQRVAIPVSHHPQFRTEIAIQSGVEKNLLFRTWGGLGDQICAEPTLRYVLKNFRNAKVSLASECPELFEHLKFERVFDLNDVRPNYSKFLLFDTIASPDESNMVWQFINHMLTNCVDFPSLCAIRCQLPVSEKEILLSPPSPPEEVLSKFFGPSRVFEVGTDRVLIHAGRHWPSKTFPKDWWDAVISGLVREGITPVLIGSDTDDNRGTVDVDATKCVDLRKKTSIMDCVWLCQHADVLLTNDSAPLHMAASRDPKDVTSGQAWIGYVATCKHPDLITHFRNGQWQWREENLGVGGIWETIDHCPNQDKEVLIDKVEEAVLRSWLPNPEDVVKWTLKKLPGS